jgi:hypothetical protein
MEKHSTREKTMSKKAFKCMSAILLALTLISLLASPNPAAAKGGEAGEVQDITGTIDAHTQVRMANAVVDLVRVTNDQGSVWVVAGFLLPTREHGLVYLSNGPWSSSEEIRQCLKGVCAEAEALAHPYRYADPRATEEDFAYVRQLEELFARSHILFWRISIVEYWTPQGEH